MSYAQETSLRSSKLWQQENLDLSIRMPLFRTRFTNVNLNLTPPVSWLNLPVKSNTNSMEAASSMDSLISQLDHVVQKMETLQKEKEILQKEKKEIMDKIRARGGKIRIPKN